MLYRSRWVLLQTFVYFQLDLAMNFPLCFINIIIIIIIIIIIMKMRADRISSAKNVL